LIGLPAGADGALATGWATVELDRAAVELEHLLAPGSTFKDAPPSELLGARCRVGIAGATPNLRIVLLEPVTEGRLAGALARAGEGWVATWALDPWAGAPVRHVSMARQGPLGKERLMFGLPPTGPYRLLVDAVPSPP
jgi:hypothetical protein